MNVLSWLALLSYLACFVFVLIFAVAYLTRTEFMPYHRIAVERPWNSIDARMQVLLLALIRVAGAAWMALVLAALLLLYPLFSSHGELWQLVMFQLFCFMTVTPPLLVALYVRRKTAAPTPIRIGVLTLALCMAGFILAIASGRYP